MVNRIQDHLKGIIKYCADITELQKLYGSDYEEFMCNKGYQYSISFCLEQIGELARKLRDLGFNEKHPEVAWHDIAGLRNRIAHGYNVIDLDMVFDISISDIPELERQCKWILKIENNLDNLIEGAEKSIDKNEPGIAKPSREDLEYMFDPNKEDWNR